MPVEMTPLVIIVLTMLSFIAWLIGTEEKIKTLRVIAFSAVPLFLLWVLISYMTLHTKDIVKKELKVSTVNQIDIAVDESMVMNLNAMFNRDLEEGDTIIKETDPDVMSLGVYYDEEVDYKVKGE